MLDFACTLNPSARGELEITDLNRIYLEMGELDVMEFGRGSVCFDGGNPDDLYEAAQFVRIIEKRTASRSAARRRSPSFRAESCERHMASMKAWSYRAFALSMQRSAKCAVDARTIHRSRPEL